MNSPLFFSLLIAHVVGDFYLQNNRMCADKMERNVGGWALYVHCLLIGIVSWLAVFSWDAWPIILMIVLSHFLIDALKPVAEKMFPRHELSVFVTDQILHIAVILTLAFVYGNFKCVPISLVPDNYPMILLAFLIGIKPANILIKLTLKSYNVDVPTENNDIKNAGGLIGSLERILTIILVILGQYEAIGFIIAAKSILRFKDTDTAKTEYVLTGTLLSFGIAMLCGLMV